MRDREQTRQEVIHIIADIAELPADRLTPDATLAALDIDSLNGLRIVAEMEKRYGINVPEEVVRTIRTISDILALIDAHLGGDE